MKTYLSALLCFLIQGPDLGSELNFEIRGNYDRPVLVTSLLKAKTLGDLTESYPTGWITGYVGSEISVTKDGITTSVKGLNDTLTTGQKELLHSAGLGAKIEFRVVHKTRNPVSNQIYEDQMKFALSVIPDKEAYFPNGMAQLRDYFEKNAISKLANPDPKTFKMTVVKFFVDEKGDITNENVSQSSGDPKTDKILLEAVQKMPKWKPAESNNGQRQKQEFVFRVGNMGC